MMVICVSCGQPKNAHTYAREGALCSTCIGKATARVEVIWIANEKFHVLRKGVVEGRANVVPLVARR